MATGLMRWIFLGWLFLISMTGNAVTTMIAADGLHAAALQIDGARKPAKATRAKAAAGLFDYFEVSYNRSRRHSTLGYQTPVQFLQDWITIQRDRKMAA